MLVGERGIEILAKANVLVVGLGGVGGYAAEMLARAGVGSMTLVDADTVSQTNINRQLIALHSTVGRDKVELIAERLRDINPDIRLEPVKEFLAGERMDEIVSGGGFDYIVDAIDTLTPKIELI